MQITRLSHACLFVKMASSSVTTCEKKKVSFSEVVVVEDSSEVLASDVPSSDESFVEITTSEEDLFSSSDDEDERRLQMILEGIHSCNPALFASSHVDLVEKQSLLLLDKDLLDSDESLGYYS